ncbi:MAG: phosphoribosylformylglycinamidine synthase [Clostridia bacterium]|nr:phosphoribosylformylglycinamidine synthase [Clostridia bacterium]
MVFRVFVEKKPGLDQEAKALLSDLKNLPGTETLSGLRLFNRYDVESITEELFALSVRTVFSEPQLDCVTKSLPEIPGSRVLAVEYLPGQFDQRADSAEQCIQILSQGDRPNVRSAKVYVFIGALSEQTWETIRSYVINPVEAREASLEKPLTLRAEYTLPQTVETLNGFLSAGEEELSSFLKEKGFAMDLADMKFCQAYFRDEEKRDPTITEIRVLDTYWSDHCRHTTFLTAIDSVRFEDTVLQDAYESYLKARRELNRTKPQTLMDLGTIAAKILKKEGRLEGLDESEEINACTVKIKVSVDEKEEDWLLLFKNETHNHPTEIEPFGGAATCIGGAIRDPLSGRSYVFAAMRVTGAADPTVPLSETIPGKLPQKKIVTTAAAGYSSYGNQIGLATGMVDELYHPGYAAKRMEIGAVIAAAPAKNVRRERPSPGDVVILLGGRTGRDGCGGATGSSKSHTTESLTTCGAEVQKGNAPEERKLQRLFRRTDACRLIKRCNDFGAGGVSVAVGELADGLDINLNAVPKKYEGLDGTELAISESQERMAVVVASEDADLFRAIADEENLETAIIATVTETPRLRMSWNGTTIVDLSRRFLDTNGAEKHVPLIAPSRIRPWNRPVPSSFRKGILSLSEELNVCSKQGLSERFDSTIGAGTVLMPFGGKKQKTPIQTMVHLIPVENGHTDSCSFMAWGYNPMIAENSPFHSAYLAVVESIAKLIAAGADRNEIYLSFQEYFEKPGQDPTRWGQPLAALLGAFRAQNDLGVAAIGGKDSMSGTFEQLDVPPTLVSFAVTTGTVSDVVTNDFKEAGHRLALLEPDYDKDGLPVKDSLLSLFDRITSLARSGRIKAAYTPGFGGVAEALLKMSLGNGIGVSLEDSLSLETLFGYRYGAFVLELTEGCEEGTTLGKTISEEKIQFRSESVSLEELKERYEARLASVYPMDPGQGKKPLPAFSSPEKTFARPAGISSIAKPRVLIPVFPGTNCEYDTAKAFLDAGATPEIFVIRNLTRKDIADSVSLFSEKIRNSQIVFLPGGFSGGDEPDGSGKFITAFFRAAPVRDAVTDLLENRVGLMAGICNGFQALIKLGLVPYGRITDTDESSPTLTFNTIGRHQSRLVRTRICSIKSPWLAETRVGDIVTVPISHGEGRFLAAETTVLALAKNGQIATQYVDDTGSPTTEISFNPNNSIYAVEGITSPDGRVLGKMGHSERTGSGLYRNVPGNYDIGLFRAAVLYYQ